MKKEVDCLFNARWVLTFDEEIGDLERGSVVIHSGRIEAVLKEKDARLRYKARDVFEATVLIPGFVNAHTHAAMVAFRGLRDDLPLMTWLREHIWPKEGRYVNRNFIELSLPVAVAEMLRTGTTTFADMYFFQDTAASIVKRAGIRAVLGEGLISRGTPAFKNPKDALSFTRDFIETFQGDDLIFPAVAPHAAYSCEKELLQSAMEVSLEYRVPYLIHLSETREEVKEILFRYGKRPAEYLDSIGVLGERVVAAHCVWLDGKEVDLLFERETGVVHSPESNLKLASGIAPIPDFLSKGLKVGLGTDGAASNNDLDMLGEIKTAALVHKVKREDPTVLKAREAVTMATLGSARVLGLDREIGSLTPGKSADLVALGQSGPHAYPLYNPYSFLVYAAHSSDITHVLVRGRVLYREGEFLTLDYEKAVRDMEQLSDRLR